MNASRKFCVVVAVAVALLVSCSMKGEADMVASSEPSMAPMDDMMEDELAMDGEPMAQGGDGAARAAALGRKLIRTARLSLMVEDYDQVRPALEALLARAGGLISDAEVNHYSSHRNASLTLRVPAEQLDQILEELRAFGRVDSEALGTEDVTRQYVDTAARLRNLQQTEARLRALLESEGETLASILEVERELTRVRGEIEAFTSQIQQLDERVALATIHLDLRERSPEIVREPDDMWRPMRSLGRNAVRILEVSLGGLIEFVAGLLTALLYVLPWLLPVALVLIFKPRWRRAITGLFRWRRGRAAPDAERPAKTSAETSAKSADPEPPADKG
ncbi:DUF4349 domain-containing protein [Haliangium ochraceum]|uniref:DUF4349 domain-containing protein n=1 Tax=Haliangium ochraceum (strain DSM 14365 / JCM 11303 / SMP-2) TaxID=502025 RepID=D0LSB1_HALO1|nr:DUF4349 domain-containing protein [Haliangium ochraceum]ACY15610.1 hypothetical protein Hoch_3106 [Haliangium ochraceum DSM 14365]